VDLTEVLRGSSESVETGYDQDVAVADEIQSRLKLWASTDCRDLFLDPLHAEVA
jgi:hypothetical protein